MVVGHFVELIDAAYPVVGKRQCSTLQSRDLGFWVPGDVCRQTHLGTALARHVLAPWHQVVHELEQLGLGRSWITAKQNMDIGTRIATTTHLRGLFDPTAKQHQQKTFLDCFVAVDTGSNRRAESFV